MISPGDTCYLIGWHLSFWGCKRHQAARPDSLVLLCSAMKKEQQLWPTATKKKKKKLQKGTKENNTQQLREKKKKKNPHGCCPSAQKTGLSIHIYRSVGLLTGGCPFDARRADLTLSVLPTTITCLCCVTAG